MTSLDKLQQTIELLNAVRGVSADVQNMVQRVTSTASTAFDIVNKGAVNVAFSLDALLDKFKATMRISPSIVVEPIVSVIPMVDINPQLNINPAVNINPKLKINPIVDLNPQLNINPVVNINSKVNINTDVNINPVVNVNSKVNINSEVNINPVVNLNPQLNFTPELNVNPVLNLNPQLNIKPVVDLSPQLNITPAVNIAPQLSVKPVVDISPELNVNPVLNLNPQLNVKPVVDISPQLNITPAVNIAPQLNVKPVVDISPQLNVNPVLNLNPQLNIKPVVDISPQLNITPAVNIAPQLNVTPKLNISPELNIVPKLNISPELNIKPALNFEPELNFSPTFNFTPKVKIAPKVSLMGTIFGALKGSVMAFISIIRASALTVFSLLRASIFSVIPAVIAFGAALLANPITWIVLGVMALIAALVGLIVYWDEVTAAVGNFFTGLGDFASMEIFEPLKVWWNDFTGWLSSLDPFAMIAAGWEWLKSLFADNSFIQMAFSPLKLVGALIDGVINVFKKIPEWWTSLKEWLSNLNPFGKISDGLKKVGSWLGWGGDDSESEEVIEKSVVEQKAMTANVKLPGADVMDSSTGNDNLMQTVSNEFAGAQKLVQVEKIEVHNHSTGVRGADLLYEMEMAAG